MSSDRRGVRGVVLCEDRRTERFVRHLLVTLGFEKRNFDFKPAPAGIGSGEAWVLAQYPAEVQNLRSRSHQRLSLLVIRDGDAVGVLQRTEELDRALTTAGKQVRKAGERIVALVPTWAIENWLLGLLAHPAIDEARGPESGHPTTWKQFFDQNYLAAEGNALRRAAANWSTDFPSSIQLPSLQDGRQEMERLDF